MVLWIAPELNHYKARLLNRLSKKIAKLHVLSGRTSITEGHRETHTEFEFHLTRVNCAYMKFAFKWNVYRELMKLMRQERFRVILMPMEKKFFPLILFLFICKLWLRFKLATYTHHFKLGKNKIYFPRYFYKKKIYQIMQAMFDIVIFYTEEGLRLSLQRKLVRPKKAFFANNTIDVENVLNLSHASESNAKNILFIGRLTAQKHVDILIDYFRELRKEVRDCELIIIGDGPEANALKKMAGDDPSIRFCGAIVEEEKIAALMNHSCVVFIPNHAGLVIVHAFAYRKPFATFISDAHPPESSYLVDGLNSLLFTEDRNQNIARLKRIILDRVFFQRLSDGAYQSAQKLLPSLWVESILKAFNLPHSN